MKNINLIEGIRTCGDSVKLFLKKEDKRSIININLHDGKIKSQKQVGDPLIKNKSIKKVYELATQSLDKLISNYYSKENPDEGRIDLNNVDYSFWEDKLYVLKTTQEGSRDFIVYNIRNNQKITDMSEEGIPLPRYNRLLKQLERFNNHQSLI